jgi:hypothetical protein
VLFPVTLAGWCLGKEDEDEEEGGPGFLVAVVVVVVATLASLAFEGGSDAIGADLWREDEEEEEAAEGVGISRVSVLYSRDCSEADRGDDPGTDLALLLVVVVAVVAAAADALGSPSSNILNDSDDRVDAAVLEEGALPMAL